MSLLPAQRISALDGLRGWAALSVVSYHFYLELFGHMMPHWWLLALSGVFNGHLAVAIFFVLSGYVLTYRGWRANDKSPLARQIAKRHMRLSLPIICNGALVLWLMASGLTFTGPAAQLLHRSDWLASWLHFDPDLWSMLQFSMFTVFWFTSGANYNPFLWTMIIELWMSYLVLAVCLFERRIKFIYGVLAALLLMTTLIYVGLGCFIAGALLALLHRDGHLVFALRGAFAGTIVILCLVAAGALQIFHGPDVANLALAGTIVLVTILSPQLGSLLSMPLSQKLGALSFPLYLAQFPVLISATSWMIVSRGDAMTLFDGLVIGTISVGLTLAVAVVTLPIEYLAQWVSNQIGKLSGMGLSRSSTRA